MLIETRPELPSSEITPESVYVNRRAFMRTAIAAGAGAALLGPRIAAGAGAVSAQAGNVWPIANAAKSPLSTNEKLNAFEDITSYNNFYEFGTDKEDPARYAGKLKPRPWTVKVDGARRQARRLRASRISSSRSRSRSGSTACAASRRGRW